MLNEQRTHYFNITAWTVAKIILVILLFYFCYLIRSILAILFVSLVLSSALEPTVAWMEKKKVPRFLGVISIYLFLFLAVSLVFYLLIPPIIDQVRELATNFPTYFEKVIRSLSFLRDYTDEYGFADNIRSALKSFGANFQGAADGLFSAVTGIFGGVVSFFLVFVITFYLTMEENAVKKIVWSLAPERHQVYVMQLATRMQNKIGLWLRGQLILSVIIFILIYIGLSILGVKYALVLALLAGLTEFVPYLGPTLAAVPGIFLAFTQSPMLAVFVAGLYYIIQMTENNLIVPKVMQKVVGLNPVISITMLLVGFKVAGIFGAVLSIPVATAAMVLYKDFFENRQNDLSEN
jgi:predicted PurR-regulated permease PerM